MATRTVTGTIKHADGSAWAGGILMIHLIEAFVTATETFAPETHSITLDGAGQFTVDLGMPASGTAHLKIEMPDGKLHEVYLASGPAVDLATLITIEGTAVDPDDLQVLLDQATVLTITAVSGTHTVGAAEQYLRCTGTGYTVTLRAATGSGAAVFLKNAGSGTITVARAGSDTIDGETSLLLSGYEKLALVDAAAGAWDITGG